MEVKVNYHECITNLACSIRKYFNLDYKHNTLPYIDELLNDRNPKNVVVILFDGLGSAILDKHLKENSFFRSHKLKDITTVFPPTTTAATTSMLTGLNPSEHGYLGWNTYLSPIDETITLFRDINILTNQKSDKFINYKKEFDTPTIIDDINKANIYSSQIISQYQGIRYHSLRQMAKIIKYECNKDGKKYLYCYNNNPDHLMHLYGTSPKRITRCIKQRERLVKKLSKKLKDTLILVIADHGHLDIENIFIDDYPEITNMLSRPISIESRATSFKIKEEYKEIFPNKFNSLFGKWFDLYPKDEVINSNLFGDGKHHPIFNEAIGDYIAIAKSNKTLLRKGSMNFLASHAGNTDDELYIPIIVI